MRQQLTAVLCLTILVGNGYTIYCKIRKAPNREASSERKAVIAPSILGIGQEGLEAAKKDLEGIYGHRRGMDKTQEASHILKESRPDIFR